MAQSRFTPNGLAVRNYEQIRESIAARAREAFGTDVKTDPQSYLGQFISIAAEQIQNLHDQTDRAAEVNNIARASGNWLDEAIIINRMTRRPNTYSRVWLRCQASPAGTTIPAGSIASTPNGSSYWVTETDITIAADQTGDVLARSQNIGSVSALANTITRISTPVNGWISVFNPDDAQVGQARETDDQVRARQQTSARAQGISSTLGIKAELEALNGVTGVIVVPNNTNSALPDGQPAGSVRSIVENGLDQDIANALFETVGCGISTHGAVTVSVTDDNQSFDVKFDRPRDAFLSIEIDLTFVKSIYPSNGSDQIREKIRDYVSKLNLGDLVERTKLYQPGYEIPGHTQTRLQISRKGSAVGDGNIQLDADERAKFENLSVDIVINETEAS